MIKSLMIKTWVWGFYRAYAGFLFFLFLVFFGFIRGGEHFAIARFLVQDIENLIYPAIVLGAYAVMILNFSHRFLLQEEYHILFNLACLPIFRRIKFLGICIQWLLFPVNLYSLFLLAVAFLMGQVVSAVLLIVFVLCLNMMLVYYVNKKIIRPDERTFKNTGDLSRVIPPSWAYSVFLIKHLLINRSLPFLLSKLISFSLLSGFTALLPTVEYYNRFIPVAIFATILSNSLIPFEIFRFTFGRISLIRNLPYRRFKVYLQSWVVMIILLLPEIVFTFRNFAAFAGFLSLSTHLMAAMAFLSFVLAGLLVFKWAQESFITKIFLAFLFIVLYLLFDLPSVILFAILLPASYLVFYHGYYRYEPVYTGVDSS